MAMASSSATRGFFAGAVTVLVVLLAYLIVVVPPLTEHDMQASRSPLFFSKVLPRVSSLSRQLGIQKPAAFLASYTSSSNFSTSRANMGIENISFKEATAQRRTIYALNKKSPIADSKVKQIIEDAVRNVPSAFNSQTARLVVLVNADHDKYWATIEEILKAKTPEEKWGYTKQRLDGFAAAYGTILFYEDPAPVKALQEKMPAYAHYFPQWSEHTSAMHQYYLWTALEAEGFGANLQHNTNVAEAKTSEDYGVPLEWALKAQLVFGGLKEGWKDTLKEKEFKPIDGERALFFGLN